MVAQIKSLTKPQLRVRVRGFGLRGLSGILETPQQPPEGPPLDGELHHLRPRLLGANLSCFGVGGFRGLVFSAWAVFLRV